MKLVYMFFAYKNPILIRETIRQLNSDAASFLIHIDRRVDIAAFESLADKKVKFTRQRVPVYWAEFSGCEAIVTLIREALSASEKPDYLFLLSGSEFPLRSSKYIEKFLDSNRGKEFMTLVKVPNEKAGKPLSRINTLRYPSNRPLRRFLFRGLARLGLAARDYRKFFGTLQPYSGHTWWALSGEACQHILDFHERNRIVARFFENTFAPEESYFHTIVGNSDFLKRTRRNLVYEDWSMAVGHPAMLSEEHLAFFEARDKVFVEDLHGSGEVLFARKLSDESLGTVERLKVMIDRKEKLSNAQMTNSHH